MKLKIFLIALGITFIAACSKDKYDTKPILKFKEVNKTSFVQGEMIIFEIDFTDKEGDIKDTMWVQRISRICPTPGINTTAAFKIPGDFSPAKNMRGSFAVTYVYNRTEPGFASIFGCGNRNDTSYFRFWMKDKAGHYSDTVSSPEIALLK